MSLHKQGVNSGLENVGVYEQCRVGPLNPPTQIPTQMRNPWYSALFRLAVT